MSPRGIGTKPATGLAPLFRGARPFLLHHVGSIGRGALPVRRMTVIPGLDGTMPPRQILLEGAMLSSRSWSFDAADNALSWHSGKTGTPYQGRLLFAPDAHQAAGTVTLDDGVEVAVTADLPPITYACAVARNTGAQVTGLAPALRLNWDPSSASWNGADWVQNALSFTYQMTPHPFIGQMFYDFSVAFADLQTGAGWSPADGTFGCLIDENFVFAMVLQGGASPPPDVRSTLPGEAGQIATVYPFQFAFQLSATAIDLEGAALTVTNAQNGAVLGVTGATPSPSISGYYATAGSEAGFAVHDNSLYVADLPVAGAQVVGTALSWQGLDAQAQRVSGLPGAGTLAFDDIGERFTVVETGTTGQRVTGEAAEAMIARNLDLGGR